MKPAIDWDLLLKHLDNNMTDEEEENFNLWLKSNYENKEYLYQIIKIWRTADNPLSEPDTAYAWEQIVHKTDIYKQRVKPANQPGAKNIILSLFQSILHPRIVKVAAILIIIIFSAYYLLVPINTTELHDVTVDFGQQQNIRLSDGSQLVLDAGSQFRYPEHFSENKREVYLNGEAYFTIVPVVNSPFVIRANQALITVIGTTFNVRAWEKNNRIIVAVESGCVNLKSRLHDGPGSEVMIGENHVGKLTGEENPSVPEFADISAYISWKERSMYFQSVPLQEVLEQLHRWYELDFELPGEDSGGAIVTVLIENRPIKEIVDLIALINNFNYIEQDGKIIFSKKE